MINAKEKEYIKIKQLFDIYSFENYKRYICDTNIEKDYKLLIDSVSRKEISQKDKNCNIYILEVKEDNIILNCPTNYDIQNNYNLNNDYIILLKKNNYFESIILTIKKNSDNEPKKFDKRTDFDIGKYKFYK